MRDNNGRFVKGHKMPEEQKIRAGNRFKKLWKDEEFIKNRREKLKAKRKTDPKERGSVEMREWITKVKNRDINCVLCGSEENLEAHHILIWKFYPELRLNIDNGLLLCSSCHWKFQDYLANFWLNNGGLKSLMARN